MKISLILGTRPEIIKMSPIIRELKERRIKFFIVHTNQHYSAQMDKIFFNELELPNPKYHLNIGSDNHGVQTGKMLIAIEKIIKREKPNIVLVQGDTNTVLAGTLAAAKEKNMIIGHIEAGLRSYDRTMPEETNRVICDHISDFLFVPTQKARENLLKEGIDKRKIIITGNTIVDAVQKNLIIARKKTYPLDKLHIQRRNYFLVTLHRPSNVDDSHIFHKILTGLDLIYKRYNIPIIFPIHPRSKKQLEKFNLHIPQGIKMISPLGYLEFLLLLNESKLILTDSGGIQEEACILRIPCVTIRENTERPETIEVGGNILAGTESKKIALCVQMMLSKKIKWSNPFGDGKSANKIIKNIHHKK